MQYDNDLDFDSIMKEINDDEIEEEEKDLSKVIDDNSFSNYFEDARISTSSTKRKTTFKSKRKKKQSEKFEIDEIALFRNKPVKIIYGPYEKNYKTLYEVQSEDGKIFSATNTGLKKNIEGE
jgi:hypothetical protein